MRKIIYVFLAFMIFCNMTLAENITPVEELTKYGVAFVEEKPQDDFVTRYECIEMIDILCGFSGEQYNIYISSIYAPPAFKDSNSIGVLHFAKEKGIIYGVTDNLFEPNRYATYQEAAAFATRINGDKQCSRDADLDIMFEEALRTNTIDKSMYEKKTENITYSDWCQILMNIIDCKCVIDAGTGLDYENLTYRQLLEALMQ